MKHAVSEHFPETVGVRRLARLPDELITVFFSNVPAHFLKHCLSSENTESVRHMNSYRAAQHFMCAANSLQTFNSCVTSK